MAELLESKITYSLQKPGWYGIIHKKKQDIKGYVRNKFCVNRPNERMGKIQLLNHLVKERFLTPVDGKYMEVHHINGVRWDNRPKNLQINLQISNSF